MNKAESIPQKPKDDVKRINKRIVLRITLFNTIDLAPIGEYKNDEYVFDIRLRWFCFLFVAQYRKVLAG